MLNIRRNLQALIGCTTYAWVIWFVASLFYGLEYFQRVAPSVMANPLMQTFGIGAGALGAILSLYFYAYALAQIPVGLLIDRYGVRRLLTLSCAIISIGTLLFATAKMLIFLAIARLLIGFGSAFAFIGVLKLASTWYPSSRYPLMVGLTNTLGVVGAIFGQAPLAKLIDNYGWSESLIFISIIGFIISALIWLLIQDAPRGACAEYYNITPEQVKDFSIRQSLSKVFTCRPTWITAFYAGLMVAPIIAFAELWAVPFLMRDYHLTTVLAADLNTAVFIGIGIGGPLNGWLGGYLNKPRIIMLCGNITALLCLLTIIYLNDLNYYLLQAILFLFGFATSSMLLAFTLNKNRYSQQYSGIVVAFTNMIIMIIGAIYQYSIGKMLDLFVPIKNISDYTIHDFHISLAILPVTSVICLLLLIFVKPERCE